MSGASTTLSLAPVQAAAEAPDPVQVPQQRRALGSLERSRTIRSSQAGSLRSLAWLTVVLVALPVFVQAPWVREAPVGATLFTIPILASGLVLQRSGPGLQRAIGALLVGFAGSWLGGSIFWGWFRDQPLWHLPIEAFALPLALGGWRTPWRLASAFYLGSLAGTAGTDLVMALSGVIQRWPAVVNASLQEAPGLLHQAGLSLLHPLPISLILASAATLTVVSLKLWQGGEGQRIAAAALATTLVVDGLFLMAALTAPRLSGLI